MSTMRITATTFEAGDGKLDSTKRYMWKKVAGPQVLTTGRSIIFGIGYPVMVIRYAVDGIVRQANEAGLPDPAWTATITKFDTLP
jgi:hypothetical protein